MADDEDDLLVDDLEGLRQELEALRAELGDDYVTFGADSDGSDAEEAQSAGPLRLPPPGSALGAQFSDSQEEAGYDEGEQEEGLAKPAEDPAEEPAEEPAQQRPQPASAANQPRRRLRNQQPLPPAEGLPQTQKEEKQQQKGLQQAKQRGQQPTKAAGGPQQPMARQAAQPKQQQQRQPKQPRPRKGRRSKAAAEEEPAAVAAAAAAVAAELLQPPPPASKVEAIREALEANRQLQGRLRRLIASTDRAIGRNATVLLQVRALLAKKNAAPTVATVPTSLEPARVPVAVGASWFWGSSSSSGDPMPPNPDAQALLPVFKHLPFSFRHSRWTEDERQRLREGVVQLVQELQLQDAMQEMQQQLESGGSVGMHEFEQHRQRIAALTVESAVVEQLSAGFREEDWATIIQRSRLQRSTTECRLQWRNSLAPNLSQKAWTNDEDQQLQRLVEQHGQRQWETVSRELAGATGSRLRPPLACLQRHQQLVAAAAKEARQFGTEEGVAQLAALVAKHGSSWKRIAEEFGGGWEADQLMHIWRRHAQRGAVARKGKWTQEEDETLLKAMALHGRKWAQVAKLVPGRTDVQCRERYMNVLNPEVSTFEPWTVKEDRQLLALAREHMMEHGRVKWSAIAAVLVGRTDKQCATRWRSVQQGEAAAKERKQPSAGRKQKGSSRKGGQVDYSRRKQQQQGGSASGSEGEREEFEAQDQQQQAEQEQSRSSQAAAEEAAGKGKGAGQQGAQQQQRPQRPRRRPRLLDEEEEEEEQRPAKRQHLRQRHTAAAGEDAVAPIAAQGAAAGEQARWPGGIEPQRQIGEAMMAASAAAPQPPPLLPAPPAVTTTQMPCPPAAIVGQLVSVWWIGDEASGAGSMYPGMVVAWHPHTQEHSVHYDGESVPVKCRLEEETVEWRQADGLVSGPGSQWPSSHLASAAVRQAPLAAVQPLHASQTEGQQQLQQQPQTQPPQQQDDGGQRLPPQQQANGSPEQQGQEDDRQQEQAELPQIRRRRRPSGRAAEAAAAMQWELKGS